MADYNSSLPVRTENNGDIATKIVDGTTTSQALAVDASGKIIAKLNDGAGNSVTSQASSGQRALDVGVNVAGVQVDPRAVRALTAADVVTANQGTANSTANAWPTKVTDGTNSAAVKAASTAALAADPSLVVAFSPNTGLPTGANTIGSVNQGTSPWVSRDQSDGPVTPGTVASFSQLGGAQFNTTLPTLTTGQQAALQADASGRLLTAATSVDDKNFGTVGANTVRSAAQIGNATGAANFGAGATGAQTLRVEANQGAANATPWNENVSQFGGSAVATGTGASGAGIPRVTVSNDSAVLANIQVAGSAVTSLNPVPVVLSTSSPGTPIQNYNTVASVAAAATSNHDYTVTAAKTFIFDRVWATGSGKIKIEIQIETGVASGVFTTRFVAFNSTATPNIDLDMTANFSVAAGVRVRVIRTNRDNQSQDVYSTIQGTEI